MTREEASAHANIQFHHKLPKELRDMVRLTTRMQREADRQLYGDGDIKAAVPDPKPNKGGARPGQRRKRWTPDMDSILIRDYPHNPRADVAAAIGVTELAARLRARRLGIQRSPQTIMAEARTAATRHGAPSFLGRD